MSARILNHFLLELGLTLWSLIQQRLKQAIAAGELPEKTDVAVLGHYFAMVVQGMAAQAHDGASFAMLEKMVEFAMQAWPAST